VLKQLALQLYRLAIVAIVVWLIRDLALRQRTHGDSPIGVEEVKGLLPEAASLRPDSSARDGLFVLDRAGRELGYVVRTQPQCRDILGYCGVTDVLVILDPDWKIIGLKVHASEDTREYVNDVVLDRRFLKKWNGMSWDAAAALDLQEEGIEGVSGATMTSMAMARSVKARLQMAAGEIVTRPQLRFGWRDWGMLAVLGCATAMGFGSGEWKRRWKVPYQIALITYVGFVAGDLVAQKLLAGWTRSGVPWSTAPGLVLLVAAAFLVPWVTRKPLYCHHVCPHGAAQELIGRIRPARFQWVLPASVVRGLEYFPLGLLVLTLLVTMIALPLDLAGIEPFAAYIVRSAGVATISVAVIGLVASFFVPQAYCRFGCPTGALLNFVRARGPTDRFSRRDAAALILVLLAVVLNWKYLSVISWVKDTP
jgi:NosR/NirI family transcriptional regulator, nitrous oxide reductase regulator